MYADDLALMADSAEKLQQLLNIVHEYTAKWRYSLNAEKSAVMVFGESTECYQESSPTLKKMVSRRCNVIRSGRDPPPRNLKLLILASTIRRTNERVASGRSALYTLNSVGTRFGRLHPLTSLRLYQSLCAPIMLIGAELWSLTQTELTIMECINRKIL